MHNIINNKKRLLKFEINGKKQYDFILVFCIKGPSLPYDLEVSAMAKSPDGRGVIRFGGLGDRIKILELRAGANSWTILDITLENGRYRHVVIPLQ